ncbi:Antitoxin [Pseudomonas chlororaphis]|uniref:hypothetical protein n=1 Tax=Pseudomonas chlororaphis TaxID=587753 RepID=UPI0039E58ADF
MIDFSKMVLVVDEERKAALDAAISARKLAYATESDPLKLEADYDAAVADTEPDYTAWVAAVEAIKQRIPLPS